MRTNYVLIDYESVKPDSLEKLTLDHFKVIVFVGASQTKLPLDFAVSLQALGSRAEYVKISGNGSNALDFHIAYYIGRLAVEEPSAHFHIISKDTGFDPLIQHLKSKKILAGRVTTVAEIPAVKAAKSKLPQEDSPQKSFDFGHDAAQDMRQPPTREDCSPKPIDRKRCVVKASNPKPPQDRIAVIHARLQQIKVSKPRTVKALRNSIGSWFQGQLSKTEIADLVQSLAHEGYVDVSGAKVAYALPDGVEPTNPADARNGSAQHGTINGHARLNCAD